MTKKKILAILAPIMAVVITLTVVLFAVTGNNTPVDTEFTFAVVDGNAVITGSSDPLSGAVMLPDELSGLKVTAIGDEAFKGCSDVTAFFIPESVTSIGSYAFENCTSLANATLPDSLTEIGDGAFFNCSSLLSVTVPVKVEKIGTCAFFGCKSLKSLVVPGTAVSVKGIFNAALDIGQVVAIGSPYQNLLSEVNTVLYCYNASTAYYDIINDGDVCAYSLLDNATLTEYTVKYVDTDGNDLYDAKTVSLQPTGISVKEVAAQIDGYEYPDAAIVTKTLSGDDVITFTYEEEVITTTEEPTTEEPTTEEPTTEEPTTEEPSTEEPSTEEPSTEEPSTEEPSTEEPSTEEPSTEEPTTEEPTTEPVFVAPELVAVDSATVNNVNGYIYGIDLDLDEKELMSDYLKVTGDGYAKVSSSVIGTGTTVTLYSSKDDSVVAVYTIVIFGDLNGDGLVTSSDITLLKRFINGIASEGEAPTVYMAADLNNDGTVSSTDLTYVKSVLNGAFEYDQVERTVK